MNDIKEYTEKVFEDIKHIDEFGNEYWSARELMKALEYKEWRKFDKVIKKAMEACAGSNYYTLDHFVFEDKMVNIGSNTIRKIHDYKLSRYACYLIVQNCNPRIKIIALAQTYFAIQTRKQELSEKEYSELSEDEKRLYRRTQARTGNYNLNKTAVNSGVKDLVPNPILIKNKNNIEIVTEKVLHNLILEDIESFMKELGNSFTFIGSEYKIKIGDRNHYIDLLLFNVKFNCYVVVEIKVTEFKVEYISQVQKYMNYIDKNIKEISNNNTMGILICKRENRFVIEYCSDDRIAVREYELV